MPNRLAAATSPYLLQHKDNPVDWWQWGEDAFAEARERGVPVLLSVGYAACHWCHVMAHESFEDPAAAAYVNKHFVPIKVDREERPDVDAVYMEATQAMTGHGGWPMTSSPAASRATAPTRAGWCRTSRRCSTTTPCSRASTRTGGGRPAIRSRAASPRRPATGCWQTC